MKKTNLKENMEIIDANINDLNILSNVLTKSLINEPMVNWIIKNDNKKLERMYLMHETIIKHFGLINGYVHTNKDKNCSAVWIKPENFRNLSLTSFSLISAWIKTVGIERMLKILKVANILDKCKPTFNCYYLMSLGVEPEFQGKGIASELLKPILNKCDNERIPAYLETSNINNLDFYEKNGFRINETIDKPKIMPLTWTMIREPNY